jgi:hypothetical protein
LPWGWGLMRARRQSESILPERPKGIHEYRAALLSVFLHTGSQGDLSDTLAPEKRPVPLPDAMKLLEELPAEQADAAREIAGCQLANAVLVEHKPEFEPYFRQVTGMDSQEFKKRLHAALPTPPDIGAPWVNYDLLRQAFYGGLAGEVVPGMEAQRASRARAVSAQPPALPSVPKAALTNLDECFTQAAESLTKSGPESTLDLTSLVTTVDIPSKSDCDFATLARILDPRSWSLSPFWPESYEVQLSQDGEGFTLPGATSSQNGESWSGYLFEHVEWNWNVSTVASFRNFLNIKYEVDAASQRLRLDFALFSCEGSQLYLLEQRQRGIDVDSGFQCVAPVPGSNPPDGPFRLRTVKNIRYTDLLDRQTPGQGPAGAGLFLSYLAPAVVGLWMNDLLRQLYCQSQP